MVGDGEGGREQKTLEPWVVEADIVDTDGNVVEPGNAVEGQTYYVRVRAWIEEEDDLIRAQFVIEDEPIQNADGSYSDYGVWTLNVRFDDSTLTTLPPDPEEFFVASCERGADGESVIKLHESFSEGEMDSMELTAEVKAVMYRGTASGYGKVEHPDWEAMWNPDVPFDPSAGIPTVTAAYAYDGDYLGIQVATDEGDQDPIYKNRNDMVEMTHQYGVFNANTGRDLMRDKQFGFPILYEDTQMDRRMHGYYGAWQGRHQLWIGMDDGQGGQLDLTGETVMKENHRPDAEEEYYTIGKTFNGTLAMRKYEEASLSDIQGIPVEIWVNQDYQLFYNDADSKWYHCPVVDWSGPEPTCNGTAVDFDANIGFASLAVGENDNRKNVNIGGWDETSTEDKQFVYLLANTVGSNTAGLYEAEPSLTEPWRMVAKQPLQPINTNDVKQLWVWVSGSLYVAYTGITDGNPTTTGWVAKELTGFDEEQWQPEFGENDVEYKLPEGRELYINMNGANYVVRKEVGVTEPDVLLELQTVAHPGNVVTGGVMAAVANYTFKEPWAENNSTYEFDTDPSSGTYLMLVYKTIGDNDKEMDEFGDMVPKTGVAISAAVKKDLWGIEAYDAYDDPVLGDDNRPVGFNWEYAGEGEDWGKVTYLLDENGDYVILSDPVRFNSISITVEDGRATVVPQGTENAKTLALQFDGWMMGLPDLYRELERSNWTMNSDIAGKIVNLQAGTEVVDSVTSTGYVIKPLEISQFIMPVAEGTDTGLDLSDAELISLEEGDIPDFVDHGMGAMPTGTEVLYSEGNPVE
jgi:hypothetical protein